MARRLRCLFVLPLVLLLAPAPAQASAPFAFEPAMESAATGHQVPLPLIQAIAYVNTRWEVIGKPSVDGGVGPFNLRPAWLDEAAKASGRPRPRPQARRLRPRRLGTRQPVELHGRQPAQRLPGGPDRDPRHRGQLRERHPAFPGPERPVFGPLRRL